MLLPPTLSTTLQCLASRWEVDLKVGAMMRALWTLMMSMRRSSRSSTLSFTALLPSVQYNKILEDNTSYPATRHILASLYAF